MPRPHTAGRRAARLAVLARRSVEVILENQARSGAYLASPSFRPYRFSWLRDGAFIADAMSRAGETASAEAFFRWCAALLERRAPRVERLVARREGGDPVDAAEHLPTRYTLAGEEDAAPWSNFQLDGYGTWLWALAGHVERHGASVQACAEGARLSARYVEAFWESPCFDWWEEREGVHTATLAALAAGLRGAARLGLDGGGSEQIEAALLERGAVDGRLRASWEDDRIDASLLAVSTPFGILDPRDPIVVATVAAIERELADVGVHRHPQDEYYGGGEWLLLTALLGSYALEVGREDEAWARLEWVARQAGPDGALPEQSSERLLRPTAYGKWVARWGPPASPLLWSHACYVDLALRLGVLRPTGAR